MIHDKTTSPTVIRHGIGTHAFIWLVFPAIGAGLGWLLAQLPRWISEIPFIPEWKILEFLTHISGPVLTIIVASVGFLIGCVVALTSYDDIVGIEVTPEGVAIDRSGEEQKYRREDIRTVFMDGKELVMLGANTAELARVAHEHKPAVLKNAFTQHGYSWSDDDPHAQQFQRWVDGAPGLDEHGQALLRARHTALETKDKADIVELRAALTDRGIVVRDVNGKQYWRSAQS